MNMIDVRIEVDRGCGWLVRSHGRADVTPQQVINALPAYAIQYPHRAWIDGILIAEALPPPMDGDSRP